MKRNTEEQYGSKDYRKSKPQRTGKPKRSRKPINNKDKQQVEKVEIPSSTPTHNDATWYYLDKEVMDQASRLSFQNILGVHYADFLNRVTPTTMVMYLNPCPGVTPGIPGTGSTDPSKFKTKDSGINLAGFKLFTKLSMQSGRTASYAPQDVETLILQLGELISQIEWGRRFFGIAFTYNMRNRVWPKNIIDMLGIDSTDFFANLANYRMRLNTIITMIKQIPIPDQVGYFKKCEMLYQQVYLDSSSPMAQCYAFNPATTWIMDETGAQGTILRTVDATLKKAFNMYPVTGIGFAQNGQNKRTFQDWLDNTLTPMVTALLESSTLNVIYADILNLSAKSEVRLWSFDYISEAYSISPVYAEDMLEIIHNMGMTGHLPLATADLDYDTGYLTPYNDVWPQVSTNSLIYNPQWDYSRYYGLSSLDKQTPDTHKVIVDLQNANADVNVRLDCMMYKVVPHMNYYNPGTFNHLEMYLPDHYMTYFQIFASDEDFQVFSTAGGAQAPYVINAAIDANCIEMFDWHPLLPKFTSVGVAPSVSAQFDGVYRGDLNYFTSVDDEYVGRMLRLAYLGLFEIR